MITLRNNWERAFDVPTRAEVEALLPAFLMSARWFGGKAKTIGSAHFSDVLPIDLGHVSMVLCFVEVSYTEGGVDTYTVPLTAALEEQADRVVRDHANAVIGSLNVVRPQGNQRGVLYDALWNEDCANSLLSSMGRRAQFRGSAGTLVGSATTLFNDIALSQGITPASVMKAEQSNTSVKFGDRVIMKLYRRVEPGVNPELEIGRTLTARHFGHSPALIGALEYARENDEPLTLALAQTFIPNQGNAWEYTLSQLSRYFDTISKLDPNHIPSEPGSLAALNSLAHTGDPFYGFIDEARLLGCRTGDLHLVLGQASHDPAFAPDLCDSSYVQSRVQTMRQSATQALTTLRTRLATLNESSREQGRQVLGQEQAILDRLGALERAPLTAMRIRCHGDYHLGQVLSTGRDFVIIDYEGEPAKPLHERRAKHIPLVDVAGMIRSFHYAVHAALRQRRARPAAEPATQWLATWAEHWYDSVRTAFLNGYDAIAGQAPFSPQSQEEFQLLLDVHVLDKALYELTYELNNRPDWVALPLSGILQCVRPSTDSGNQGDRAEHTGTARDPSAAGRSRNEVPQ